MSQTSTRTVNDFVFVAFGKHVVGLDRYTGEKIWQWSPPKGAGYISILLDGDRLIVSTNGYIYCLEPFTGQILWHNPLKGYGAGAPTSLISVRGQSSQTLLAQVAGAEAARASSNASAS